MIFVSIACGQMTASTDTSTWNPKYLIRYNPLADSLINFAQAYLKTPYRYGATGIKTFDCSGFTGFVYQRFGYTLSRSASGQANDEGIAINRTELQPGDLVFFKGRNTKKQRIGHVGIVVDADGEGRFKFIHASVNRGITITDSREAYYLARYISARRILKTNFPDILIEPIKVVIPSLKVNTAYPPVIRDNIQSCG
jgi:cell wall-associated NlpC family hydrolase